MKVLHAIIAILFIVIGLSIYTGSNRLVAALIALLISNVSLAAISIENSLTRGPIEVASDDPSSP